MENGSSNIRILVRAYFESFRIDKNNNVGLACPYPSRGNNGNTNCNLSRTTIWKKMTTLVKAYPQPSRIKHSGHIDWSLL